MPSNIGCVHSPLSGGPKVRYEHVPACVITHQIEQLVYPLALLSIYKKIYLQKAIQKRHSGGKKNLKYNDISCIFCFLCVQNSLSNHPVWYMWRKDRKQGPSCYVTTLGLTLLDFTKVK